MKPSDAKDPARAPSAPPRDAPGRGALADGAAPFALLLCLVAAVYLRTAGHGFIDLFDDGQYLTGNGVVRQGLTARGVAWAFTTFTASNWHPLAWISHMADVSLFGMENPGGHHLVSTAVHGANALLLFAFLRRSSGAAAPSLFAAALFAVHPVHVESVAWLSERKDLLCALFFLLALHAWRGYALAPSAGRYGAAAAAFALALLSKPMAVTLPFVLLLLDLWPLGRTPLAPPADGRPHVPLPYGRLLLEKAPLLLLAAASSAATLAAQGAAVATGEAVPLGQRVVVALVSYVEYLRVLFVPAGLAMFYPFPAPPGLPAWQGAAAALLLAALTALAVREVRRRPYLLAGWLWYLGTLVPVIGLVKVGGQAMADRYAYLPFLGLYAAAAWGIREAAGRFPSAGKALPAVASVAVAALAVAAFLQAGRWKDQERLFLHTLAVTEGNFITHNNLGSHYAMTGRRELAVEHFEASARINPRHAKAFLNAGEAWSALGRPDLALERLREAFRLQPGNARAANDLGEVLEALGRREEAAGWFRTALALEPSNPYAAAGLARVVPPGGGPPASR